MPQEPRPPANGIASQEQIPALTDRFPHMQKHFGRYLAQLVEAMPYEPAYFVAYAFEPEGLERRLRNIEAIGQTQAILAEVGRIGDPVELDRRLRDAWAEIRTIDQLHREGFEDIQKVTAIADFRASKDGQVYAFQVKRIDTSLTEQIERRVAPEERSSHPYGSSEQVHKRFDRPMSWLFWEAVLSKNERFRNWRQEGWVRCIVIVSNDERLQSPRMVRHIACQQIAADVNQLENRHFEEILWLPDLGNGVWFKFGAEPDDTRCLVDWSDSYWGQAEMEPVQRSEIDLESDTGAYQNKDGSVRVATELPSTGWLSLWDERPGHERKAISGSPRLDMPEPEERAEAMPAECRLPCPNPECPGGEVGVHPVHYEGDSEPPFIWLCRECQTVYTEVDRFGAHQLSLKPWSTEGVVYRWDAAEQRWLESKEIEE